MRLFTSLLGGFFHLVFPHEEGDPQWPWWQKLLMLLVVVLVVIGGVVVLAIGGM